MKSLPGNHSSTVLILLTSVALFNVAHAQVDRSGLTGIVADSRPEAEYEETLAKAAGFLTALPGKAAVSTVNRE